MEISSAGRDSVCGRAPRRAAGTDVVPLCAGRACPCDTGMAVSRLPTSRARDKGLDVHMDLLLPQSIDCVVRARPRLAGARSASFASKAIDRWWGPSDLRANYGRATTSRGAL